MGKEIQYVSNENENQKSVSKKNDNEIERIEDIYRCDDITTVSGVAYNVAILDSGCSSNVCGSRFLEVYKESLNEEDKKKLKMIRSDRMFRFGDGKTIQSTGKTVIPAYIGKKKVGINVDIVEQNLPLLLSRNFMEKTNTKIGFQNNEVYMLGKKQRVFKTDKGHLCIPLVKTIIIDDEGKTAYPVYFGEKLEGRSNNELKKIALKLHIQFGHCSSKRLIKLLENSKFKNKVLFNSIRTCEENCEVCQKKYQDSF